MEDETQQRVYTEVVFPVFGGMILFVLNPVSTFFNIFTVESLQRNSELVFNWREILGLFLTKRKDR